MADAGRWLADLRPGRHISQYQPFQSWFNWTEPPAANSFFLDEVLMSYLYLYLRWSPNYAAARLRLLCQVGCILVFYLLRTWQKLFKAKPETLKRLRLGCGSLECFTRLRVFRLQQISYFLLRLILGLECLSYCLWIDLAGIWSSLLGWVSQ